MQHALDAVTQDVGDPESSVYHHRIQLRSAVPYRNGWLVRIRDTTAGATICVVDLPQANRLGEDVSIRPCDEPAPSQPAPSAPPSI
jgi:hypothetical protein